MGFIIIIPARFFSSRLPGKPLILIDGKPMIIHVIKRALLSNADRIIVATDHIDIIQAIKVEKVPVEICLTRLDHKSGTERLEEVITYYNFDDDQIIVNLQGDEPLMPPDLINKVADNLLKNNISMSTVATPIRSIQEVNDINVIKVVIDINNFALYFSRSMIPWCKDRILFDQDRNPDNIFLRHIGLYSYRVNFIHRYVNWMVSSLETNEFLEQLRVLWHGEKIYVLVIDKIFHISVDTQEDVDKINVFFRNST